MRPRDFAPGDDHGYVEGVPYAEVLAMWDPESIDSPERYWPYTRALDQAPGVPSRSSDGYRSALSPQAAQAPAVVPALDRVPDQSQEGKREQ
jgi:hypothetical protein